MLFIVLIFGMIVIGVGFGVVFFFYNKVFFIFFGKGNFVDEFVFFLIWFLWIIIIFLVGMVLVLLGVIL